MDVAALSVAVGQEQINGSPAEEISEKNLITFQRRYYSSSHGRTGAW